MDHEHKGSMSHVHSHKKISSIRASTHLFSILSPSRSSDFILGVQPWNCPPTQTHYHTSRTTRTSPWNQPGHRSLLDQPQRQNWEHSSGDHTETVASSFCHCYECHCCSWIYVWMSSISAQPTPLWIPLFFWTCSSTMTLCTLLEARIYTQCRLSCDVHMGSRIIEECNSWMQRTTPLHLGLGIVHVEGLHLWRWWVYQGLRPWEREMRVSWNGVLRGFM